MGLFDYKALALTQVEHDPFDFVVVKNFVSPDALARINRDFPQVPGPGSHPPSVLNIRGHFKAMIDELGSAAFRTLVESKFGLELGAFPTMCTVRGYLRERDGKIHTDSTTKVITVLIYLNSGWTADGGRLRLLRDGENLENYAAEIPPDCGTLLIFKRSSTSWHGHKPFSGRRRAIQFNWVASADVARREQNRHAYSTRLKQLGEAILHQYQ